MLWYTGKSNAEGGIESDEILVGVSLEVTSTEKSRESLVDVWKLQTAPQPNCKDAGCTAQNAVLNNTSTRHRELISDNVRFDVLGESFILHLTNNM